MSDTTAEIERMIRERVMSLSGAVRMRMGADMFVAAQRMILASLPLDLPEFDRKRRLYERVYGSSLPKEAIDTNVGEGEDQL